MKVILSSGSNLGDRLLNLQTAFTLCTKVLGPTVAVSNIYETAAWGIEDQNAFLNQVFILDTMKTPQEVMKILLETELGMGRRRELKWGPRLIDLDILFYENNIVNEENLQIPHPHMASRRFILAPLSEVAPGFIHPVTGVSVAEMLSNCADPLPVRLLEI